jgi:hypothetical protein
MLEMKDLFEQLINDFPKEKQMEEEIVSKSLVRPGR